MRKLKIVYISALDPRNKRISSGSPYLMFRALEKHCGEVEFLGTLTTPIHFFGKALNGLLSLTGKRYNYGHSILLAKSYSKIISKQLEKQDYDIIFSHCETEISLIKTKLPIIFTTDGTIPALAEYYPYFSNLLKFSYEESLHIESLALNNSSLILYASEWVSKSAQQTYGIHPNKIRLINYGANLEKIPEEVKVLERKPESKKCRLLFIGVDWRRKGGEIAFNTLLDLQRMGIDSELTVCGVTPPKKFRHKDLKVIPFLDKNKGEDQKILTELYLNSDIFLLPTRAECAGIVFCEASAFGLPIVATDTGGVSSYVHNGINGHLLPLEAKSDNYATVISQIYCDDSKYKSLVKSSRELYDQKLNWDVWGKSVRQSIYEVVGI